MSGILALGSRICNQTPTLTAQVCADPSSQRLALLVAAGVITFTYLSASFAIQRFQNRPIQDLTGAKLREAAGQGNLALVNRYIAGKSKVNPPLWAPLSAAAANGHTGVVKALLLAGADANTMDTDQRTALHRAAASGHSPVVELLFPKCSEDTKRSPDKNGDTPAHLAAKAGSILSLNLLVVPRPKTNENKLGQNIQHLFAIKGIEYFRGWEALLGGSDNKKNLPVHYAAQGAHKEVALSYLRETRNPDVRNADGLTPLHVAIKSSRNSDKVIAFIESDRFDVELPTAGASLKTPLELVQESDLSKKDDIVRLINAKLAQQQQLTKVLEALDWTSSMKPSSTKTEQDQQSTTREAVAVPAAAPIVVATAAAVPADQTAPETPFGELARTFREQGPRAGFNLWVGRIENAARVVLDPQRSVLEALRRHPQAIAGPPRDEE